MPYSVLLIFQKPNENDPQAKQKWEGCASNLKNLTMQGKGIQLRGENVVQLPLDHTLQTLCDVLNDTLNLDYTYAIFDEEIEWHEVSKKV